MISRTSSTSSRPRRGKSSGKKTVSVEDVLTYAMFPKVAPKFFKSRTTGPVVFNVEAEVPKAESVPAKTGEAAKYVVNVNGADYTVVVRPEGTMALAPAAMGPAPAPAASQPAAGVPEGNSILAPVAGLLLRYVAAEGSPVAVGQTILVLESMKMELEIKATVAGSVHFVVPTGTSVASKQLLANIR